MRRREIPASLKALGREPLPAEIVLPSGTYRYVRTFKHLLCVGE